MADLTREELISELTSIYKAKVMLNAGRATVKEIEEKGVVSKNENGDELGPIPTKYYQDTFSDRYYDGLKATDYKAKTGLIEMQPTEKLQRMLKAERDALEKDFKQDNIPFDRMADISAYENTKIVIAYKKSSLAYTLDIHKKGLLGIDDASMAVMKKNKEAEIRSLEEELAPAPKPPVELEGTIEFDAPETAPQPPGKKMFRPVPPNELPSAVRQRIPSRVPNAIEPKPPAQRGTEPPDLDHEGNNPRSPDSNSITKEFKEPTPSPKRERELEEEKIQLKKQLEEKNKPPSIYDGLEKILPPGMLKKGKDMLSPPWKGRHNTPPVAQYDGEAPATAPNDPTMLAAVNSFDDNRNNPMASDFNKPGAATKKGGKGIEI